MATTRRRPAHQVNLVQIPPAQVTDTTKLMTAVRGGTGPDIYLFDRFIVAQRAADGLLQDLSALGANDLMGNYVPFAAAEAMYNGNAYCLPFDTDARALYYNKGMITARRRRSGRARPGQWSGHLGPGRRDREPAQRPGHQRQLHPDGLHSVAQPGLALHLRLLLRRQLHRLRRLPGDAGRSARSSRRSSGSRTTASRSMRTRSTRSAIRRCSRDSIPPSIRSTSAHWPCRSPATGKSARWSTTRRKSTTASPGCRCRPLATTSATWAGGWSVVIPEGAKNVDEAWAAMQWICGPDGGRIYTEQSAHSRFTSALYDETDSSRSGTSSSSSCCRPRNSRPPLPVGAKYWDELTVAWQNDLPEQGDAGGAARRRQGAGQWRSGAVLPDHAHRTPARSQCHRWLAQRANACTWRGPDWPPPSVHVRGGAGSRGLLRGNRGAELWRR